MRVEHINDHTIRLYHERISFPMEIWTTAGSIEGKWFWNLVGGAVIGSDTNMVVAIEKAMVDLERVALG